MMLGSAEGQPDERAEQLGLRRVSWVRVVLSDSGGTAEAFGVGHRRPQSRWISVATAAALGARGVPIVVRDLRTGQEAARAAS